jgi:putative transposase
MSLQTFQYRLYPSQPQERRLSSTLETCRRFYNFCLAERKDAFEQEGRSVRKTEQLRHVKEWKASNPFATGIHSHILQGVVSDLDKAFTAFFRRLKSGEKPGYPRFRGYGRFHSIGLKEYGNGFKGDGRRLKVSGVGRIAVRWHREMEGAVKTVRLVRKADGWYASFCCEVEDTAQAEQAEETQSEPPEPEKCVGVDVGISSLITTSDGEKVDNPKWYRNEQKKLRVAQRRVSRRKKGGKNRRKAVKMLARRSQKVQNRRKDFLNKLASRLLKQYDCIVLEDLRIANMVRNEHLSKSILDAGWGYLVSHLAFKAACAGKLVELVNPADTSKTCSCCGRVFEDLTLKVRWVNCPQCGLSMDRDENAAVNILKRSRFGQSLSTSSLPVGGLVEEAVGL